MTSLGYLLSRADRQRLAGRLAELRGLEQMTPEPGSPTEAQITHICASYESWGALRAADTQRPAPVTALTVTVSGSQSSLTAPARAVPGIRAGRSERPAAASARTAGITGEPLLDLAAQTPDRGLGLAQPGDHPRLDGHLADKGIKVGGVEGHDGICESLLRGGPGHVTTIAVTPSSARPPRQHAAETATAVTSKEAPDDAGT